MRKRTTGILGALLMAAFFVGAGPALARDSSSDGGSNDELRQKMMERAREHCQKIDDTYRDIERGNYTDAKDKLRELQNDCSL